MPHKLSPKSAAEALHIIATVTLPQRARAKRAEERRKRAEAEARQQAKEAAREAANVATGAAAAFRRPTVGSPEPLPRQERTNLGYMRDA